MTDGITHSTQYHIKYKNRAISANLQYRPLELGRSSSMGNTPTAMAIKNSAPMATHSFLVPTYLISICW